jgi:hypothetical protein
MTKAQRLLVAILLALSLSWLAASPADTANPPLTPLRALCAAQQGTLFASLNRGYVVCDSDPAIGFTAQQATTARLLCTHAYGGLFVYEPPSGERTFPLWYCVFSF